MGAEGEFKTLARQVCWLMFIMMRLILCSLLPRKREKGAENSASKKGAKKGHGWPMANALNVIPSPKVRFGRGWRVAPGEGAAVGTLTRPSGTFSPRGEGSRK